MSAGRKSSALVLPGGGRRPLPSTGGVTGGSGQNAAAALPCPRPPGLAPRSPDARPLLQSLIIATAFALAATSLAQETKIKIVANEFSFRPAKLKVPKGEVEFVVTNRGRFPHSFAIVGRPEKLGYIESGETQSLKVKFESQGEVVFYCAQPGHRGRGMEGKISVGK